MAAKEIKLKARTRAFRGGNPRAGVVDVYQFIVEADGTVRIYDSVVQCYTRHHGMTPSEEARVRNLARKPTAAQIIANEEALQASRRRAGLPPIKHRGELGDRPWSDPDEGGHEPGFRQGGLPGLGKKR
jgi:hypothetical protein